MQVIFMFLCLVAICVAVFYYFQFEKADEEVAELEADLDECIRVLDETVSEYERVFDEINDEVIEKPDLNSAKKLKNKLKTILESVKITNIVK